MDRYWASQQTAMRLRADEAMKAALAVADDAAPSLTLYIENTMSSINVMCADSTLDPRDRRILIDDALLLLAALKQLLRSADASRAELFIDVLQQTNFLLSRYTRFVQAGRPRP